jgi:hypothetical protein
MCSEERNAIVAAQMHHTFHSGSEQKLVLNETYKPNKI